MRWALLVLALSAVVPSHAENLPALFDVTGVASDDSLNVRSAGSAQSDILGTLAYNQKGVEVIATGTDGKWGQIGWGERNGWVAMRFLKSAETSTTGLPTTLRCFGAEPFWSVSNTSSQPVFRSSEDPLMPLILMNEASGFAGYFATFQSDDLSQMTLSIERAACSDGMSDRIFGLRAMLFQQSPSAKSLERGCCTLDAR